MPDFQSSVEVPEASTVQRQTDSPNNHATLQQLATLRSLRRDSKTKAAAQAARGPMEDLSNPDDAA